VTAITATSLTIVDNQGNERITLGGGGGFDKDDSDPYNLTIKDKDGKDRATLFVSDDGASSFFLSDRQEKARVSVSTLKDGTPLISLKDPQEKTRLSLQVNERGPLVRLLDEAGKPVAVFPAKR
jgi:hypothetical protein